MKDKNRRRRWVRGERAHNETFAVSEKSKGGLKRPGYLDRRRENVNPRISREHADNPFYRLLRGID